jgi:hypothetical protein
MRADMRILGGLLFIWDVPSFRNAVSVGASQKNPILHFKNKKYTLHGKKWKATYVVFLAIPRATHLSDMGFFFNF